MKNLSERQPATFEGVLIPCLYFEKQKNTVDRIEIVKEAREKYNSYNTIDWIQAGFDEFSGGYMVYHKDHFFDPTIGKFGIPRGDYERNASKVLVKYGKRVVLCSEKQEYREKTPDGLLNGILFDIKGIEGIGKNNIINNLKSANKKGVESIVFYFHDKKLFSEKQLIESYQFYLRNSKSKRIQQVYYIVDKKLYLLK